MALARLGGDDGSEAVGEDVLEQVPQYILVGCEVVGAAMLKFHRFAGLTFAELDGIGAYQRCRAEPICCRKQRRLPGKVGVQPFLRSLGLLSAARVCQRFQLPGTGSDQR